MFTPRTTPVKQGEQPFAWNVASQWQCTWFCFYEALFHGYPCPQYWDRTTKTGSYTDAKYWLQEYRDPWIPITDPNYKPVAGDILVYDGEHGHVIYCETDVMTTEYRNGDPNSFRVAKVGDYNGHLLGVLHYPYETVSPIPRNTSVNQIECTDETLRIRTKPSLSAEIVGHVSKGYYNVLNTKEADGYKWYKIANDRWCADIGIIYYPVAEDFVKQLEEFLNVTRAKINSLQSENEDMRNDMKQMKNIAERWI